MDCQLILIEQASEALDQDCPPTIDHRKHDNPYKSRYGSDWKTQLKKSVTFCHSVSICDYIEHMMEQSRNIMKDTIHEDTWMVYHDALSLMTSKSTKEWMRKKGYLKRWILPSEDLFDNLPAEVKSKYKQNPIGNSPEFMPLDAHLNQDVHSSHDFHKILSEDLPENDPKKFSGSTPHRLASSYLRLFHPITGVTPSSKRIIDDVTRVIDSLEKVRGAQGCIIDESSAKRKGRRYEASGLTTRGGKRTKQSQNEYLRYLQKQCNEVHDDLLDHWKAKMQQSAALSNFDEVRDKNKNSEFDFGQKSDDEQVGEL